MSHPKLRLIGPTIGEQIDHLSYKWLIGEHDTLEGRNSKFDPMRIYVQILDIR